MYSQKFIKKEAKMFQLLKQYFWTHGKNLRCSGKFYRKYMRQDFISFLFSIAIPELDAIFTQRGNNPFRIYTYARRNRTNICIAYI